MKKAVWKFGKAFAIVFAALMVLSLASCSGLIQKTGSVSFVVDQELLNAARGPFGEPQETFRLEIALEGRGGFKLKQTLVLSDENFENFINKHGQLETSFNSVPVGKTLSALVKVYRDEPWSTVEVKTPIYIGRSRTFSVRPGNNKVSLALGEYFKRFEFTIRLETSNLMTEPDFYHGNIYAYAILADSTTGRKILSAGTRNRKIIDTLDSIDFENDVIQIQRVTVEGNVLTYYEPYFHYSFTLPVDENSPLTKGQKVLILFAEADADNPQEIHQTVFATTNVITPIKDSDNSNNCSFIQLRPVVVPNYTLMYTNRVYTGQNNGYEYTYTVQIPENDTPLNCGSCGSYTAFDSQGEFYTIAYYPYGSNPWLKLFSTNTQLNNSTILQDDFMSYEINPYYKDWDIEYVGFAIDVVTDTFYAFANDKVQTTGDHYNVSSMFHIVKYPDLISSGELTNDDTYSNEFPGYLPLRMVVNNGICYCLAKSATDNSYTLFTFAFGDEDPTRTKVKIITNLSSLAKCTDMVYLNDYIYILFNDNNDSRYDGYIPASYSGYDYNSSGVLVRYDTYTRSAVELGNSNKISFSKMYVGYEDAYPGEELYVDNGKLFTLSGSIDLNNQEKLSKYFPSVRSPKESRLSDSFIGSEKFLAIMPKKLVVSDYGRFYYADINDALAFNTKNRTVDIDLEGFFIAAVTDSTNYFDEDNENHSQATSIEAMTFDYADLQNLIPNGLAPEDIWGYQSWSSSDFLAIKSENYPEP